MARHLVILLLIGQQLCTCRDLARRASRLLFVCFFGAHEKSWGGACPHVRPAQRLPRLALFPTRSCWKLANSPQNAAKTLLPMSRGTHISGTEDHLSINTRLSFFGPRKLLPSRVC